MTKINPYPFLSGRVHTAVVCTNNDVLLVRDRGWGHRGTEGNQRLVRAGGVVRTPARTDCRTRSQ